MDIIISNKSDKPIYEQIYDEIRKNIISGAIKENEGLPSIRGLAKDLKISVITTKRAYEELERDGYIYTLAGKGSFVAEKNLELIREENLRKTESLLTEAIKLGRLAGLTSQDLEELIKVLGQED